MTPSRQSRYGLSCSSTCEPLIVKRTDPSTATPLHTNLLSHTQSFSVDNLSNLDCVTTSIAQSCSHARCAILFPYTCGACFLWSWQLSCAISVNHIFLYTTMLFYTTYPLSSLTFTNFILLDTRWPTPHQVWLVGYVDPRTLDCEQPDSPTYIVSFSSYTIPILTRTSSTFSYLFLV